VDDIVDDDNDSSRGPSGQSSPDHSRRENVHSATAAPPEEGERDDLSDRDAALDWTLPANVARERQALTTIRESREMGGRHRGSAPSADGRSASAAGGRPGGSARVSSASSTVRQALPGSPARSAARTRPTSADLQLSSGTTTRLHKEQRPASASLLQGPKGLAQMVRAEHEASSHPNAARVEYVPSPGKSRARPASAVSAKVAQTEDAAEALAERPAPAFHQKASKQPDEKEIVGEESSTSMFDKKNIQKRNEQLHAAYGARPASVKGSSSSRAPGDPQKASASSLANPPRVVSRPPREGRLQAAKKAVHSPQVRARRTRYQHRRRVVAGCGSRRREEVACLLTSWLFTGVSIYLGPADLVAAARMRSMAYSYTKASSCIAGAAGAASAS